MIDLENDQMAEPLETACSLVGRFQYHFGRVEQKIDQAVIKLLDLDDKAGTIVTGSVAFASKVNFVRTSAYQQAVNETDKKFAEKTCDDVFAVNNVRQIVIHSSFEPHDGGVQFRRTVARDGRVRVDDQVWNGEKFSEHFSTMRELETDLDKLIELIKPVEPNRLVYGLGDPAYCERDGYTHHQMIFSLEITDAQAQPLHNVG
jgi:hypothetical protein